MATRAQMQTSGVEPGRPIGTLGVGPGDLWWRLTQKDRNEIIAWLKGVGLEGKSVCEVRLRSDTSAEVEVFVKDPNGAVVFKDGFAVTEWVTVEFEELPAAWPRGEGQQE